MGERHVLVVAPPGLWLNPTAHAQWHSLCSK